METNMIEKLESNLDSFNPEVRYTALEKLIEMVHSGQITLPPAGRDVNLHCHTFFSYNTYGYSPCKYAWLARRAGLAVAGIVDFDVLEGLEEFFRAARLLNLKACVGMETRVFVPEFADKEITSPGEPGITYHMGMGFPDTPFPVSQQKFAGQLYETAQKRNRELMQRVNEYLAPVCLDFEKDVLSLTPAKNPTERHICVAFARKAQKIFSDKQELRDYWAAKLSSDADSFADSLPEGREILNLVRARTMKRGGVGYIKPDQGSFPSMAQANAFILASGGIPTHTWLNGASDGEKDMESLLRVTMSAGVAALNIIPDRNYTEGKNDEKLRCLYQVVELAEKLHLPVIVGTEMNGPGQKFVDSFDTKELSPLLPVFLKGAHIVYAHSVLQSQNGLGYISDWANENFIDTEAKNRFFKDIGENLQPQQQDCLKDLDENSTPEQILEKVKP